MAKNKVLDATNKIVAVLQSLDTEERMLAIDAALMVLGDRPRESRGTDTSGSRSNGGSGRSSQTSERGNGVNVTPKSYVDEKEPENKVEELAVAARYRELYENAESSTKDELGAVLGQKGARRNFNAQKFRRDAENARRNGLFTKGSERGTVVLSHYGQQYVDALPDREKLKTLAKPRGATRRRTASRKRTQRA